MSSLNFSSISTKTKIDSVIMDTCIMNASGCLCSTKDQLDILNSLPSVGAIVGKSSTITPRTGHKEPRLYVDEIGSINSMGVPNLGYDYFLYYQSQKPFIHSIYPFTLDDMEKMLYNIDLSNNKKRLVEINISCPNLVQSKIFPERLEEVLHRISMLMLDDVIVGIKMPPLFSELDMVASILLKYTNTVRFIVCTNTLSGMMVDTVSEYIRIAPNDGIGGIGGQYIKPIALANVYRFSRLLQNKISIIGCGGCYTGKDVFEYLLCGARAVQIGSCLLRDGYDCFDRILGELKEIMENKGYRSTEDFVDKIKAKL
jgi:dihydroorotate dehydrogenase (fumarate)